MERIVRNLQKNEVLLKKYSDFYVKKKSVLNKVKFKFHVLKDIVTHILKLRKQAYWIYLRSVFNYSCSLIHIFININIYMNSKNLSTILHTKLNHHTLPVTPFKNQIKLSV